MQRIIRLPGKSIAAKVLVNAVIDRPEEKPKDRLLELQANIRPLVRTNSEVVADLYASTYFLRNDNPPDIVVELLEGFESANPVVLGYASIDQSSISVRNGRVFIGLEEIRFLRSGLCDTIVVVSNGGIVFSVPVSNGAYSGVVGDSIRFSGGGIDIGFD